MWWNSNGMHARVTWFSLRGVGGAASERARANGYIKSVTRTSSSDDNSSASWYDLPSRSTSLLARLSCDEPRRTLGVADEDAAGDRAGDNAEPGVEPSPSSSRRRWSGDNGEVDREREPPERLPLLMSRAMRHDAAKAGVVMQLPSVTTVDNLKCGSVARVSAGHSGCAYVR